MASAPNLADKNSLGLVGWILAGITAGVVLIAGVLVVDHVEGRLVLDGSQSVAEMSSTRVR